MSQEVNASIENLKDLGRQAKLEMDKRGREKESARQDQTRIDEGPLSRGVRHGEVSMAGSRDLSHQAAIEARKQTRKAKVAMSKTSIPDKVDDAKMVVQDAAHKVESKVRDVVQPPAEVISPRRSAASGVDVSFASNPKNEFLAKEHDAEVKRAQHLEEREKEKKRQEVLEDVKRIARDVSGKTKEVTRDASVVLGKAAVAATEKLNEYTDDRPDSKMTVKRGEHGIDTTTIENPRNEELTERQREVNAARESQTRSSTTERIAAAVDHAAHSVKQAFEEATTSTPPPIYVRKTSSSGIDISHMENSNNPQLAAAEEARLREQREKEKRAEAAAVGAQLKPAQQSLKAKLSDLGASIKRALNSPRRQSQTQLQAEQQQSQHSASASGPVISVPTAQPVPPSMQRLSEPSASSSSSSALASSSSSSSSVPAPSSASNATRTSSSSSSSTQPGAGADAQPDEDLQTKVVKGALDAAVAVKEAAQQAGLIDSGSSEGSGGESKQPERSSQETEMKQQHVKTKQERSLTTQTKQEAKGVADVLKKDISDVKDKIVGTATAAPTAM